MPSQKRQLIVRISDQGSEYLDGLREKLGLSVAGVVELAIRRLAEAERLPTPTVPPREAKTG